MLRNVNKSGKKDSQPMVHSSNTFNDIHLYETKSVRSEGAFLELTGSYIFAPDRAAMATYNTLFDKKENTLVTNGVQNWVQNWVQIFWTQHT